MDEGTMIWYEGSGIYQDGVKIGDLVMNEVLDLLTQQGYTIIQDIGEWEVTQSDSGEKKDES